MIVTLAALVSTRECRAGARMRHAHHQIRPKITITWLKYECTARDDREAPFFSFFACGYFCGFFSHLFSPSSR